MRRSLTLPAALVAGPLFAMLVGLSGCGSSGTINQGTVGGIGGTSGSTGFTTGLTGSGNGSGNGTSHSASSSGNVAATSSGSGTTGTNASAAGAGAGAGTNGGNVCTPGTLQCLVVGCPDGGDTTISGTILDPAGVDPLYNVVAYVPNMGVSPLPSGATCASCNDLFSGQPIADGLSDADGHFVITSAPVSANVPVIIQVGKWRTHTQLNVAACQDNPVGTVKFPSKMDPADTVINMPDIAVSTGGADSLECLLVRIGIDPSEYVPGASTAGKVHIFNGGSSSISGAGGLPETNQMAGAPASDQALWNSGTSMQPYDVVLLSCEGDETYDANPANLETYLNTQGGRVFASHYHYSWFTGSTEMQTPSYSPPSDWGTGGDVLANWTPGSASTNDGSANTSVVTTLPNGMPFIKGQNLLAWLGNTNALGVVPPGASGTCQGISPSELCVAEVRENSTVVAADTASQGWITDASAHSGSTLYFSFNTPVNYDPLTEGVMCQGRAVFSGLHVGGASYDSVNCTQGFAGLDECTESPATSLPPAPPPAGCDTSHPLTPQEKALEFMLFDLASCVVPDTANPADAGTGIMFK